MQYCTTPVKLKYSENNVSVAARIRKEEDKMARGAGGAGTDGGSAVGDTEGQHDMLDGDQDDGMLAGLGALAGLASAAANGAPMIGAAAEMGGAAINITHCDEQTLTFEGGSGGAKSARIIPTAATPPTISSDGTHGMHSAALIAAAVAAGKQVAGQTEGTMRDPGSDTSLPTHEALKAAVDLLVQQQQQGRTWQNDQPTAMASFGRAGAGAGAEAGVGAGAGAGAGVVAGVATRAGAWASSISDATKQTQPLQSQLDGYSQAASAAALHAQPHPNWSHARSQQQQLQETFAVHQQQQQQQQQQLHIQQHLQQQQLQHQHQHPQEHQQAQPNTADQTDAGDGSEKNKLKIMIPGQSTHFPTGTQPRHNTPHPVSLSKTPGDSGPGLSLTPQHHAKMQSSWSPSMLREMFGGIAGLPPGGQAAMVSMFGRTPNALAGLGLTPGGNLAGMTPNGGMFGASPIGMTTPWGAMGGSLNISPAIGISLEIQRTQLVRHQQEQTLLLLNQLASQQASAGIDPGGKRKSPSSSAAHAGSPAPGVAMLADAMLKVGQNEMVVKSEDRDDFPQKKVRTSLEQEQEPNA
jgi:hypothetical protein